MSPELKHRIQVVLVFAILIAGGRTAYILYQRKSMKNEQEKKAVPPLNADYYVVPKKLYPYDLKSARQLMQQPVWVKEGYRYTFYPYDAAAHRADLGHEAGQLLPIERLEIKDVMTQSTPGGDGQREVLAIFEKEGKQYAFPIGSEKAGNYQIYSDEMLFIQDPRELYKHWPPEIWQEIDKHEVTAGMNEFQVAFSVGMGVPERSDDPSVKTVNYPNGGKPISVTYRNGRAAEIKPGSTS
ncbi:MAG TPA: hypothetical protein VJQ82_23575 [Terriglobales bacterium]|nr:hypothetical protein [Terriglobales bacterium]